MSNSKENAIVVKQVFKTFHLPHEQASGMKQAILNITNKKKGYEIQKVLTDISFEVKKGEFFGIVGRNGSGKSTLLKILAGVYVPDSGLVQINGLLTPFIELGVGFNHELTGRENVYMNGALLGMSRQEMDEIYNDIVDFAELEDFMDQKLKNYSSGMQVRLAFSIAIRAKTDILIMDEVLAVGDAAFQKKCFDVFRRLKNEGKTIILVTHDMGNVERFCDRVLILDKGGTKEITTPQLAAATYSRLNVENNINEINKNDVETPKNRWGVGGISVESVKTINKSKASKIFNFGEDLNIDIRLKRDERHQDTEIVCGLAVFDENGANLFGPNSQYETLVKGATQIKINIPKVKIAPGEYSLTVAIFNKEMTEPFDFLDKYIKFNVISENVVHGMMYVDSQWHSS